MQEVYCAISCPQEIWNGCAYRKAQPKPEFEQLGIKTPKIL